MMLVAAMVLTSCGNKQTETEKDVPLKITYSIECSRDLLDFCDMVVTYKGDDGVDVVDTITANPGDSTYWKTWNKEVQTHKVPVKFGLDYTFVQKVDTLIIDQPYAILTAKGTIIAEKMGLQKRIIHTGENAITDNRNFYKDFIIMREDVVNTRSNLAKIIDIYNDRQAYRRGNPRNSTCFLVKPRDHGEGLKVRKAPWNDDTIK